jgi:signal transduction histidine kinase
MYLGIADNGKGIDLDKHGSSLFGLYRRFDTSVEGKGIGLFMVKTRVEALGGTIQVKSKLLRGSEFTIMLPSENPGIVHPA